MIRGKILKSLRGNQLGRPSHSTRTASLQAYKQNLITIEQLKSDNKTIRRQNLANHGSTVKTTRWADITDDDLHLSAHLIADIIRQRLCINLESSETKPANDPPLGPNVYIQDTSPPSPPFSYRSNTNSDQSNSYRSDASYEQPVPPTPEATLAHPLIPNEFGKHCTTKNTVFQMFNLAVCEENPSDNDPNEPTSPEEIEAEIALLTNMLYAEKEKSKL
jgi:hypothetical protein